VVCFLLARYIKQLLMDYYKFCKCIELWFTFASDALCIWAFSMIWNIMKMQPFHLNW